jgi:integrase
VLNDAELAVLWGAASDMGYPFGTFIQISIYLGQRRTEIAGMRWGDIDDSNSVWTIPAEANKAGRPHAVPLPQQAKALLASCPKIAPPPAEEGSEPGPVLYVFTSNGERPISGFSKFTTRLHVKIAERLAKLKEEGHGVSTLLAEPWTLHDLRRTAGTGMAGAGVQRFIIGRVLNHADASVTGVYDRWQYLEEKRAALKAWADRVQSIIQTPLRDAA